MTKIGHYVAIEGPLRVGKTTLATALADRAHGRLLLDETANPHLAGFYMGRPGAAFRAQMHFLMRRYALCAEAHIETSKLPVVSDYLFERDKLFAYLNLDDDEVAIYDSYYEHLRPQIPTPGMVVYIRATPQLLRERLASGPEARVSDAYLEATVRAYDHFFDRYPATDLRVVEVSEADLLNNPKDLHGLVDELAELPIGGQALLPL